MKPVVLLDRDGVINQESPDYITSWEQFSFIPGSRDALRRLHQNGCEVIVVTNQSAVNRGLISISGLHDIHEKMKRAVDASGGKIADILFCPHRPDEGCDCRKPKTGMISEALNRHGFSLDGAVMVGDSERDVLCGRHAGVGRVVLVKTGYGVGALESLQKKGIEPDYVAENLADAARWILISRICDP